MTAFYEAAQNGKDALAAADAAVAVEIKRVEHTPPGVVESMLKSSSILMSIKIITMLTWPVDD